MSLDTDICLSLIHDAVHKFSNNMPGISNSNILQWNGIYISNKLILGIEIIYVKSWYMCSHWAVSTQYIPFLQQEKKQHNTDLHYSDLTFDDKPRSRKPIQIYDLNGLNNSLYSSEVMMPSVWPSIRSFRDLGSNSWYLRIFDI